MLCTAPTPALKPPLKWAGGKRWLVPQLQQIWQSHRHRRLVEPFVGGLAVSLGLQPQQALLNDANPHLINFYRWLQQGGSSDLVMLNQAECYYQHRQQFNNLIRTGNSNSGLAAQLFYYLNRTGFNGLCRFNSQGEFNVPFGRYKTINYTYDFWSYVPTLTPWQLYSADFATLPIEPADFIYADPPYDVEFTRYSQTNFTWVDQIRLAEWLAQHLGPVVVSNQATERILDLYSRLGFKVKTLAAPRRIACTGDRTPALEMLAHRGL